MQLILQVFFYSAAIYAIWVATGLSAFSLKNLIKALLPTTFTQYWFFTAYIVLFLLSPFINKGLKALSKLTYINYLVVIILLWCVAPTFTTRSFYGSEIPQFVMLYSIGAYLRLYPDCKLCNKKTGIAMTAASFFLMILSTVTLNTLGSKYEIFSGRGSYFYGRTSLLVITCATGLLIWAINSKPIESKLINEISACTFGIYLIHDNNYVRPWLWKTVFKNATWAESAVLPLHMVASVLITFIACCCIEFLRRKTIEKIYLPQVEQISKFLQNKYEGLHKKEAEI